MTDDTPAYGLWLLVIVNALVFIIFAFSFFKPRTPRDWRTFGTFSAFGATTLIVMGDLEVQMLDFIQIHSDHIAMAIVAAIPIALLILRPKVSCCRRRRWEQPFGPPPPVKRHHESKGR